MAGRHVPAGGAGVRYCSRPDQGHGGGLRDGFGNLSAPRLLLALLTGAAWRGLIRGARAGWLATTVALIGFYVAVTWLSRGSLGGSGLRSDFVLEVRLNGLYFRAGTISGPVLGAVGGWIARRRLAVIPIVAGALLASEILAVAVVQGRSLPVGPGMFFLSVVA